MSEYEHDLPPSDDPEWVGLILDVETRFESLNEALADLRSAVIRLSAYRPPVRVIEVPMPAEVAPVESAFVAESQAVAADGAGAADVTPVAAAPVIEAEKPVEAPVAETTAAPSVEDDEARRAEVSRMVAETRAGHKPAHAGFDGSWAQPHDASEVDSTSEGSWPIARAKDAAPVELPPFEEPAIHGAAPATEEGIVTPEEAARREEVARMVAEMRLGLTPAAEATVEAGEADVVAVAEDSVAEEAAVEDGGASTEEAVAEEAVVEDADAGEAEQVTAAVAESASSEPEAATAAVEAEEPRHDVAKMVAELRAQMAAAGPAPEEIEEPAEEKDEEARREEVAEMVARMRAESMPAEEVAATDAKGAAVDDVDVRDEVRRAVEAARAEMASGWVKTEAGDAASGEEAADKKFSFPDWQNAHMEPSGPPVIVIKDPEGRVELARVYETLSQVNCDENAALLNYTPHSVTVGLNIRAAIPTKEALEAAIEAVFGRKCKVESDGVRLSVDIGRDRDKESAA